MTALTKSGGGICPLCIWAQDNGHPHPCITNPNAQRIVNALNHEGTHLTPAAMANLASHPARPVRDMVMQPVDRTWCVCGCRPGSSTALPGAARS